jgi:hypothetical protein
VKRTDCIAAMVMELQMPTETCGDVDGYKRKPTKFQLNSTNSDETETEDEDKFVIHPIPRRDRSQSLDRISSDSEDAFDFVDDFDVNDEWMSPWETSSIPCVSSQRNQSSERTSLIAGVGSGLFTKETLDVGDAFSDVSITDEDDCVESDKVAVKTSLIAGVGRGAFVATDLQQGDVAYVKRRKKLPPTCMYLKESLITGVGVGAFLLSLDDTSCHQVQRGDVLFEEAIEATPARNESFVDCFQAPPRQLPLLGDWSDVKSMEEFRQEINYTWKEEEWPTHGWLKLHKNILVQLVENMADEAVVIPASVGSLFQLTKITQPAYGGNHSC